MAEKRMFTGKITESDAFLDMPLSSQCLYFHLCMYADDEGFVKNPKRIQKMIGANDDDLRVLIGKNFVISYENGVIVIKHWKMHNCIRKDRLHETEYLEEKAMLYVKENGAYTLDSTQGVPLLTTKCQTDDRQMTDKCQTDDSQMSGMCHTEIRLDKNNINKSISKDILRPTSEVERVVSEWNNLPEPIKKVKGLKPNTDRYKMLIARIKEYGIDDVLSAVRMVGESDFLRRGSDNGWTVDFGWFVRPNNFPKVLEGKYANKGNPAQNYRTIPKEKWDSYMWNDAIKDGYATNEEYREWRTKNVTL